MPLIRINLSKDTSTQQLSAISDVIYDALTSIASVPQHDKFQIISRHAADELVYPQEGYLGVNYTPGIVFIQITWSAGRTIEVKRALYKAIAEGIHLKTGLRIQDVWINLLEVPRENWSFGNGEMQYVPLP